MVWVDDDGALHLTIRRRPQPWHFTEVVAVTPLGFGRYRFRVRGELSFDQKAVAAMFLYLDDQHEIDIEVAGSDPRTAPPMPNSRSSHLISILTDSSIVSLYGRAGDRPFMRSNCVTMWFTFEASWTWASS